MMGGGGGRGRFWREEVPVPGEAGEGGAGGARTEHLAQKTLLVCIRGTSLCPTGSTGCPWQKARGQRPKCVFLYLSSIALRPRGVMMKRAWMRPYSSSAADSIDSCAAACVLACARGRGVRVAGAGGGSGCACGCVWQLPTASAEMRAAACCVRHGLTCCSSEKPAVAGLSTSRMVSSANS